MSDSRTFVLVLLLAALVPVVLLAVVRLAVWAVPPSHRWIVGFELRHRFVLGILQGAVLLLWAFAMSDIGFGNLFFRIFFVVWAIESFWNAVRHRRGQQDWFTSFIKKRYSNE